MDEQTTPVFAEDVEALLRSDQLRDYRIDIETDSTIKADLGRQQETISQFIGGTAQFIQAWGPAVQTGIVPPDAVMDLYGSFASVFGLQKRAEDALERISAHASKVAQQQAMQQQQGNQEAEKEAQAAAQQAQIEQAKIAASERDNAQKLDIERERIALDRERLNLEAMRTKEDATLKRTDLALRYGQGTDEETGETTMRGTLFETIEDSAETVRAAAQTMAQGLEQLHQATIALTQAAENMARPKRVVRDHNGRIAGLE